MIYFIRQVGTTLYKIGYTANGETLKKRISTLQVGNPYKLEIVKTMDGDEQYEAELHRRYWNFQLSILKTNIVLLKTCGRLL